MADVGFWQGIIDNATGRGELRLVLQPLMATIIGIRIGMADAKAGDPPFFKRLVLGGGHRAQLAKQAAKTVLVPFLIAIVLDGVLQYLELGRVRPLAAVIMGAVLIWVPFVLAQSIANRVARRVRHPHEPGATQAA